MGISLDRDLRIAGYRASTFKNALAGYLRTKSPASLIDLKSIFAQRRDGAIVYEECLDRDLIDRGTGKVSEAGLTLVRSKVVARTPLEKAQTILEAFLERVDQLNHDPEAISRVDEVWLFGSLLREEASVGDIDLAGHAFQKMIQSTPAVPRQGIATPDKKLSRQYFMNLNRANE